MKRIVSMVLVIAVICLAAIPVSADDVTEQTPLQNIAAEESDNKPKFEFEDKSNGETDEETEPEYNAVNYLEYIGEYKATDSEDIVISEEEITVNRGGEFVIDATIPADSWYNLEVTYKATESDTGEISFALSIDGRLPFSEADQFVLPRRYADNGEIRKDGLGNEFTPLQIELYETQVIRPSVLRKANFSSVRGNIG